VTCAIAGSKEETSCNSKVMSKVVMTLPPSRRKPEAKEYCQISQTKRNLHSKRVRAHGGKTPQVTIRSTCLRRKNARAHPPPKSRHSTPHLPVFEPCHRPLTAKHLQTCHPTANPNTFTPDKRRPTHLRPATLARKTAHHAVRRRKYVYRPSTAPLFQATRRGRENDANHQADVYFLLLQLGRIPSTTRSPRRLTRARWTRKTSRTRRSSKPVRYLRSEEVSR
jgi:hypothetical protein